LVGCDAPGASPASAMASPLPTPHSQPSSVPQADPLLPSLSPHPGPGKAHAGTPDNHAPKSVSSLSNQVRTRPINFFISYLDKFKKRSFVEMITY